MSVPAYPAYKDSGVEWLGEVPAHWELRRFKHFIAERNARSADGSEELLSVSAYTGVRPRREALEAEDHLSRAESLEGYKLCYVGDLVINIMLAWNRGLGVARHDGMVSPAYSVFSFGGEAVPSFWDYYLRSDGAIGHFERHSTGVIQSRLRMYPETFLALPCAVPPPAEQAAIAAFLDRETGKIDALVEEQRRLIALLKEKRQAVISHAVTKGLNPQAPLKPSGIEWLADIPAHWEVVPLKRHLSVVSGFAFPSQGFSHDAEDTPLLRGVNVAVGRTRWDEVVYWSRSVGDGLGQFELRAGDTVIGMDRPWIEEGLRVTAINEDDLPCLLLQRTACLRPDEGLLPEFLRLLLTDASFYHHCAPEMTGVSVPHISPSQIGSFVVAVPPVEEQRAVVDAVSRVSRRLQDLITASESAAALLQERRAALISAAVTGKIDVRGLVATPGALEAA